MFRIGYAQEIITPPTGVGLAGYFNYRPNQGMYDDLMVKVVMIESNQRDCGSDPRKESVPAYLHHHAGAVGRRVCADAGVL